MKLFQLQKDNLELKRSQKKRRKRSEDQLDLFAAEANVHKLHYLSPFEEALALDEENDANAVTYYLKAIEENDCPEDAYCNLGIIEFERENYLKSFGYFLSSLRIAPSHIESHFNIGNLYFLLNDYKLAKLHFEIAVEIDPGFRNAYFNLSLACAALEEQAAAEKYLEIYNSLNA